MMGVCATLIYFHDSYDTHDPPEKAEARATSAVFDVRRADVYGKDVRPICTQTQTQRPNYLFAFTCISRANNIARSHFKGCGGVLRTDSKSTRGKLNSLHTLCLYRSPLLTAITAMVPIKPIIRCSRP